MVLVTVLLGQPVGALEVDQIQEPGPSITTAAEPDDLEGADGEDEADAVPDDVPDEADGSEGDGAGIEDADGTQDGEAPDGGDEESGGSAGTATTSSTTTSWTTTTIQQAPTSVAPATTSTTVANPLLVAGPASQRRQLDPDPATDLDGVGGIDPAVVAETEVPPAGADDAERVIRMVVIGLIAVAVLLAALAVYYWWITRPAPVDGPDDDDATDSAQGHSHDRDGIGGGDEGDDGDGTVDPWLTDSTSTR